MTTIAGIVAGVAAIIGGLVYLVKTGIWSVRRTPSQVDQGVDQDEKTKQDTFENTGRPS